MRLAKRRYYEKKLEDAKSNTHATWKILNEVLNRKKSRPQLNTIFKSDGQEISDPGKQGKQGKPLSRQVQPLVLPDFRLQVFLQRHVYIRSNNLKALIPCEESTCFGLAHRHTGIVYRHARRS